MSTAGAPELPEGILADFARRGLEEDVGDGDITTGLLIPVDARASATLVARSEGVVVGLPLARAVFLAQDPTLDVTLHAGDGDVVSAGATLATVRGAARAILTAERVALNYLGRLSGIATLTRTYVEAVEGTGACILDTRKTTPGLRVLEKYAVACGGGDNHRMGLHDAFMLKDNHRGMLHAAGVGVAEAVADARRRMDPEVFITVEADTLEQVEEALAAGADGILLDNMSPDVLAEAVARIDGAALAEASGGITLDTVRTVAESGVDRISVGALTHSAPALDVALDFEMEG